MGEVDDLVVGAVDNQNGSLHLSHLINAARKSDKIRIGGDRILMSPLTWGRRQRTKFSLCFERRPLVRTSVESGVSQRRLRVAMPGPQWAQCQCSDHTR